MAGTPVTVRTTDRAGVVNDAGYRVRDSLNKTVVDVERLRKALAHTLRDQVVFATTTAGLSVDANANDIEMDAAIIIQSEGMRVALAQADPIDISALISAASTISTSKAGVLWVFGNRDGSTIDVEVPAATQAYDSAIIALSHYHARDGTYFPMAAGDVPIGCVQVTEGGSGAFTWGTDSITAETETYYTFNGAPSVLEPMASFAKDAGAATFTYGAAKFRLGTGTIVAATGKTGVTIAGSTIAPGATGAWVFYALADDTEYALPIDNDFASLGAARSYVESNDLLNPLMPPLGAIYVTNGSTAVFTPGTTAFDAAGITATFDIYQNPYELVDKHSDLTGYEVNSV